MHTQIFVNLPISDMPRARAFYEAMGYRFEPNFTNDQGACLVLGENLYAMLLVREFFQTFTAKPVGDPHHQGTLDRILEAYLQDGSAWQLTAGGGYVQRPGDQPAAQARGLADTLPVH